MGPGTSTQKKANVKTRRDRTTTDMDLAGDDQVPVRALPVAGVAFVALTALFMGYLLQNYDGQARTLDLFGTTLQLGENEDDHGSGDIDAEEGEREDQARPHDD